MAKSTNEIRQAFLDFFESNKHLLVSSAPMVVKNDPTLMFTNAGMNQFKDIFLGNESVKNSMVANTQKCLRVSGKHNDLEEVGHDTYHHTMFEMLGNWSFGEYFKKEAIALAWEFLTEILGLDKDRLYATVFEGDESEDLDMDREALKFWTDHLPEDQVLKGSKKDNFWEMGESGPCGPCSEVHIDLRPDSEREVRSGRELVNTGDPTVIELWNLVFIQHNRKANGKLEGLSMKHIDTGLGLERLAMVMQGKISTYDTDLFQTLIAELERITGNKYGENESTDIAMRVVTDHLRAVSFSIADNQLPSNNKAGYVIRRILRRAVRYGYTYLGQEEPFIYNLAGVLSREMGDAFPEIPSQLDLIKKVIREEESSFLNTLANGMRMLDQIIEEVKIKKLKHVEGKSAFILYDTYGFPLDLTQLILRENGLVVSQKDFEKEMAGQKTRSKAAASVSTGEWQEIMPADSTTFLGYDLDSAEISISRYRETESKGKILYHLVFDQTPFYAESGGQVGDSGIIGNDKEKIRILDTQKENNLIVHHADKLPKEPAAKFTATVDSSSRLAAATHHTATHLLHHALRNVLGEHVEQKGSLVHPDYLRFDFSHFQKLENEELDQIESMVNRLIRKNIPFHEDRSISMKEATNKGALAFFGEKYGDKVRVVSFGDSIELCGGIHVNATGEIGFFRIVRESAIATGIRRIEAVAGYAAEKQVREHTAIIRDLQTLIKSHHLPSGIQKLMKENSELKKRFEGFAHDLRIVARKNLKNKIRKVGIVNLIAEEIQMGPADNIKNLAFELKGELDNLVLVLGASFEGKAHLSIIISENLVKDLGLDARQLIREVSGEIQGGGGGQDFYATAGGKNPGGIPQALNKISKLVEQAAGK
jgi:alanyl-tRNA synthetase